MKCTKKKARASNAARISSADVTVRRARPLPRQCRAEDCAVVTASHRESAPPNPAMAMQPRKTMRLAINSTIPLQRRFPAIQIAPHTRPWRFFRDQANRCRPEVPHCRALSCRAVQWHLPRLPWPALNPSQSLSAPR